MKRSPRHGWTAIELRDDRWHVVEVGDRDALKGPHEQRTFAITRIPLDPSKRYSERNAGHACALYDALGQRRDEYPAFPRTSNGARIEWPITVPADGEEPLPYVPRGSALAPASEQPREVAGGEATATSSRGCSGAGTLAHTEK
jgi:hypothetical protein